MLSVNNEEIAFGTNILDVKVDPILRTKIKTGVTVFDFALGGKGFTPSHSVMFTGVPGAGKTSLILKLADKLTKNNHLVVFNGLEESPEQVAITCERLNVKHGFLVSQEPDVDVLLAKCDFLRDQNPGKQMFLFVDSLQCMEENNNHMQALAKITSWCKKTKSCSIVIGMVGKDGKFAGRNKLKHMIDTFIELGIENKDPDMMGCRIVETTKNRFGIAGQKIWLQLNHNGQFHEVARLGLPEDYQIKKEE